MFSPPISRHERFFLQIFFQEIHENPGFSQNIHARDISRNTWSKGVYYIEGYLLFGESIACIDPLQTVIECAWGTILFKVITLPFIKL